VICANCGTENAPGAKFCSECGARLGEPPAPREERKVVSVVFCDVVGSTARAESADPEDVRAALNAFYAQVRADLERFGGTVEKFIGDAVMAVFGAPVAHEDDPERAVRAALAIRDWAREDGGVQVRVAVNTGEALVAVAARADAGEAMVAGDVVNTAARLQSAAPENGVLVGEATHRATREAIEYEAVGGVEAKGKAERVSAWLAVDARSRVAVELAAPATPLVGRERERDLLLSAFGRARDDRSTELVTIVGVPGMGKSRLVAELYAELEAEAALTRWRHGRSLPYGEGLAFWALAEMVRAEAGIRDTDTSAEAGSKLAEAVAGVLATSDDGAWVESRLRRLVGLEADDVSREESFGAWRRFVEALAEQRPTVLVFEDIHWAGDDLLDFIDELADWVTDVPLLLIATARPELVDRRPGWGGGKRNAHTVSLAPLDDEQTARLMAAILDRHLLPAETQQELLRRAGGNPLYAEQFARMLEERGGLGETLPESVQAIIAARLDSLPAPEKALLLDAAVLGRTFWPGALGRHDRVAEHLRSLQRKEFVRRERRSSVGAEDEFSFAHLLVRDVAYAQIPRQERAEAHARAARWIESLSDRSEDTSELLAYHYIAALELARAAGAEQTELVEPAIAALIEATERALALSAVAQAERYASTSLELLDEGDARRPRALFQLSRAEFVLGRPDGLEHLEHAVAGFRALGEAESAASAEVEAATWLWNVGRRDDAHAASERALALVEHGPPSRAKAAALVERGRLLMVAQRLSEAIEVSRPGLVLAEQFGDERLQARALITIGASGNSVDDLRRGIEIADRADAFIEILRGRSNLAEQLLLRGDLAEIDELYDAAEASTRRAGWLSGVAWIDMQRLTLSYLRGDWDAADSLLERLFAYLERSEPHVLEFQAWSTQALLAAGRGDTETATSSFVHAVDVARAVKDPQAIAPTLCQHARFLQETGHLDAARALLDEVLTFRDEEGSAMYFLWLIDLGWLVFDLGRVDEFPGHHFSGVWLEAGAAIARGELAAAADRLGAAGFRTDEAYARLRLAEQLTAEGRLADGAVERDRALAFYREVGATPYMRRAEALLAQTA
jgi:class 3 adenylate cyclase/tetratricopeptide (TPR) repeat protein